MGQTKIILFLAFISLLILVLIAGVVIIVLRYRDKKLQYDREMKVLEEKHKFDLLQTQLSARQQTMQFIGQELHDSVTQKLTLASIYSQQAEYGHEYSPGKEKLTAISLIINDSLLELRDLSRSLTDTKIQEASLPELIRLEADQMNVMGMCKVTLETKGNIITSISEKSNLIRVVQEFFQNSMKHAACRTIKINIEQLANGIKLVLSDDGKGFDPDTLNGNGIGLENMKRRVQFTGGDFQLISGIGKGTTVNIFVPAKTEPPEQL